MDSVASGPQTPTVLVIKLNGAENAPEATTRLLALLDGLEKWAEGVDHVGQGRGRRNAYRGRASVAAAGRPHRRDQRQERSRSRRPPRDTRGAARRCGCADGR